MPVPEGLGSPIRRDCSLKSIVIEISEKGAGDGPQDGEERQWGVSTSEQ